MKASANKTPLSWPLRILLWINILNSLLLLGAYLGTHISPNSLSYLYFLGLGYPILLVTALIFIVLWLFYRRKLAWISIIALIFGFNHLRHYYAITLWQPDLEESIKVMSFNVHVFDLYNPEFREANRDRIFDFLKEESPDVICFQEFFHQDQPSNFQTKDMMIPLLEMPYYQERYTHELDQKRYFGVATFSKYPIVYEGEIPFENDDNNYCIYTDILKAGDTIRVFNAHIGSIRLQNDDYEFFGDQEGPQGYLDDKKAGQRILGRIKNAFEKRAVQVEIVAEKIAESPYPVIYCGDMNDTPVSYSYRQINNLLYDGFVESGNGIGQTYIGKVPSNRIDYIFYDEHFKSANFTTHQVNLSDHKPISIELELQKD